MNSKDLSVNTRMVDYPSELTLKEMEDKLKEEENENLMTVQGQKKYAIESLEQFHKIQNQSSSLLIRSYLRCFN